VKIRGTASLETRTTSGLTDATQKLGDEMERGLEGDMGLRQEPGEDKEVRKKRRPAENLK